MASPSRRRKRRWTSWAARLAADYPKEDPGKGIAVFASSDVRVHPQMDGLLRAARVGAARRRRAGAGDRVQQPGHAAARARDRPRERGVGPAGPGRDARAARSSPADGEPAAVGGRMRHRLPPGLVGDPIARRARAADRRRSEPGLPGPDLRARALARHRRGVRPRAGAQGHAASTWCRRCATTARRDRRITAGSRSRTCWSCSRWRCRSCCLASPASSCRCSALPRPSASGFAIDGVAMLETDAALRRLFRGGGGPASDEEIRRRIGAIPGVQSAVLTRGLPMQTMGADVVVEGDTAAAGPDVASAVAGAIWAGPGYFDLLRIPILFGRALDERDRRDTPRVAVISETMARQYFGEGRGGCGRRPPLQARPGPRRERLDRGGWRGARHRHGRSAGATSSIPRRSCSIARSHSGTCRQRPCWRGRRPTRPASSAPCNASCAR